LAGHSLLAVFAHPDDESIACGGLLTRCAERGARVSLICATHGEYAADVRDENLYTRRAQELDEAAAVLGLAEVVLFDYGDGFLPWVDPIEFDARLISEIRRLQPDVVVTFGEDGLYWHPDHCTICRRTTAAVAALGADAPALYYVTMPPGMMRRLIDEFPPRAGDGGLLGVIDADAFGVEAAAPTLVVDVADWAVRKLTALKCHRSQIGTGVLGRIRDGDAPRLLGVEHFHRAPVASTADAFIERL
jgi:N-acetyl-1-D-myo-inositol-2-amino-2-deoxy-alpha-D-glucopyranoside deacetylase